MGAAATIEVSFENNKTGELLSDEEIRGISKTAQEIVDSFDFSSDFYKHFNEPNKYAQWALKCEEESKKERPIWFLQKKEE